MKRRAMFVAAALALLYAAPAAHAFTVEDQGGAAGGRGFTDLDKPTVPDRHAPVSRFGNENSQTTIKQGNTTLQFGAPRSFNQRYNSDNLFDPYARDGR